MDQSCVDYLCLCASYMRCETGLKCSEFIEICCSQMPFCLTEMQSQQNEAVKKVLEVSSVTVWLEGTVPFSEHWECICVSVEMEQSNIRMTHFSGHCPPLRSTEWHACSSHHFLLTSSCQTILKGAFAFLLLLHWIRYVWVILELKALWTTLALFSLHNQGNASQNNWSTIWSGYWIQYNLKCSTTI